MTAPTRTLKDWIQTYRGEKFFPLDPKPEEVHIEDIARALSMLCRYGGHVARFYSVAEHSVHVSRMVYARTKSAELSLWGLLHDASEAYIADVTRPVKHQRAMQPYRDAEKKLQAVICEAFGLPVLEPREVTEADVRILGTEAVQLKTPIHPDWHASCPGGELPPPDETIGRLGWAPELAENAFLRRFRMLAELRRVRGPLEGC